MLKVAFTFTVLLFITAPAWSQKYALLPDTTQESPLLRNSTSKLNEIIVTGASHSTVLRKNPVPIATISRKEMQVNVNNNIIDAIVKGIPGVSAVTTGPNISKPFIRGLGYNRVLTMYDGIRQEGQQWGDEHGIEIDQYGIERVEVVKGPASLTYGSDALAGVIHMIPAFPKGPTQRLNGDLTMDYHTNNGMLGTSLGLAYGRNAWKYSFRATAKAAHSYQNKVDGFVYNTAFREYNITAMAGVDKKWGSSRWAATLYDNLQEIPDGSRDSLTRQFTRQIAEIDSDVIAARPIVPKDALATYRINPIHQHIQHYRFYTHNKLKLQHGELLATLGFQQSLRREYNHPSAPDLPALFLSLQTYSYDFRYQLPQWRGLETTVGVNGMYQVNRNREATDFPIPDYQLADIGGFVFARKSMGKIDLSGGIRYDLRTIHWNDFYVGKDPATGFGRKLDNGASPDAILQYSAFRRQYTGLSGSLGATYNINERVLLKANIARGYRAPNITEIGSNGLDPGAHIVYLGNRDFQPEFSLQEDLGILAYLREIDLGVELYNNQIDGYIYQAKLYDEQEQPVIIVPGNTTYQYQQSKARLYGGEFTLNLHPTAIKWLVLNSSMAYTVGLNKNSALIAKEGNAAKYLPFIPPLHIRSELRASFQQAAGRFSKIYARVEGDYYAAQDHFYGVDHTETATPGYFLLNAGCGAAFHHKKGRKLFDLFLQMDNVLDKAYQSNGSRLKYFEYYTASPNGRAGIYNIGRNFSLKAVVPL